MANTARTPPPLASLACAPGQLRARALFKADAEPCRLSRPASRLASLRSAAGALEVGPASAPPSPDSLPPSTFEPSKHHQELQDVVLHFLRRFPSRVGRRSDARAGRQRRRRPWTEEGEDP
jgi:hypothetical protein